LTIYHLSIKIISRGKGKSAVAAAAYRAGETITNEYDGITHDYSRKGGVVHAEILLPENAPEEYRSRAVLWNAVEKSERYKTAQLAREIEIALPVELTTPGTDKQDAGLDFQSNRRHCSDTCGSHICYSQQSRPQPPQPKNPRFARRGESVQLPARKQDLHRGASRGQG
jgi:hypothetical protein